MSDWEFFWQSLRVSVKAELIALIVIVIIVAAFIPFAGRKD